MSVRIIERKERPGIPVAEMKDGQVARIVAWARQIHVGRVVQRYHDSLVLVGEHSDESYPSFFAPHRPTDDYRVQILPDGKYELEVLGNNE